jgi:two-component system, NarL family, response regulator LiaR
MEADRKRLRTIIADADPLARILTTRADDELGIRGLRAGACAFITKDVDLARLPGLVEGVASGDQAPLPPALIRRLIEHLRSTPEPGAGVRPVDSTLTTREWEVLDRLSVGASADDIAEEFALAPETVRSHVKNILRKLNVHSRVEAVEVAKRIRQRLSTRATA